MKCDNCDNEAVRTSLFSHLCADCLLGLKPLEKIEQKEIEKAVNQDKEKTK